MQRARPSHARAHASRGQAPARSPRVSPVGTLLRQWRERRRLSQLGLAMEAEVSSRHLSFVETGRAQPSREMVLLLARTLDVPARARNELLTAAGFAPVYRERGLGAPGRTARARARGAGADGRAPRPRLHAAPAGALPRPRPRRRLEYRAEQWRGAAAAR